MLFYFLHKKQQLKASLIFVGMVATDLSGARLVHSC
jgi:hypothetical protein